MAAPLSPPPSTGRVLFAVINQSSAVTRLVLGGRGPIDQPARQGGGRGGGGGAATTEENTQTNKQTSRWSCFAVMNKIHELGSEFIDPPFIDCGSIELLVD